MLKLAVLKKSNRGAHGAADSARGLGARRVRSAVGRSDGMLAGELQGPVDEIDMDAVGPPGRPHALPRQVGRNRPTEWREQQMIGRLIGSKFTSHAIGRHLWPLRHSRLSA